MARMLLGSGDVVLIADSDGVRDIISTEGIPLNATTPLSVLVNEGTASASEVVQSTARSTYLGGFVWPLAFPSWESNSWIELLFSIGMVFNKTLHLSYYTAQQYVIQKSTRIVT